MKFRTAIPLIATLATLACGPQQGAYQPTAKAPPPDPRAQQMWGTDLTAAKTRAAQNNKLVLVDFTGSDWCPPCIALHEHVLTQPEFLDYAEQHLELVALDFPRDETKINPAHAQLALEYQVNGFPTIIVMDPQGKPIHRLKGFDNKNAKAFTADLKKALGQ